MSLTAPSSIDLHGGSIVGDIGNNVVLSFTAPNTTGVTIDTAAPPQTVAITEVTDDVAPVTGPVANGGSSNDTAPVLSGTISAPLAVGSGEVLGVYRDGNRIGSATVTGTTWTYADSGLADGTYAYSAVVED